MSDVENTIPSRENSVGKHIIISQFVPSDLLVDDLYRFGLVNLISQGYGYKGTEEELLEQTRNEYGDDDKKTLIFLAFDGRIACGSLAYRCVDETRESGARFWQQLQETSPIIANSMKKNNLTVQDTLGIVVGDTHKRQGIAAKLMASALSALQPGIIIGETKNPAAVTTRTGLTSRHGFRTFFDGDEITKDNIHVDATEHNGVLAAYYAKKQDTPDSFGVIYTKTDILLPTIPNTSGFPDYIQRGFQPIINAQIAAGNTKTAIKPLISIRADLLPTQ